MMSALQARQVERVVWVNLSERSGRADYVAANQALSAARARWPDLYVLDWKSASAGNTGNRSRWFVSDGIHLTLTGQAEMARFIRDRLVALADFPLGSSLFAWDRETGSWAVRSMNDYRFRLRSEARWSTAYDMVVAGDFDRDGKVDDLFVWARGSAQYAMQTTISYTPWYRARGALPAGYDDVIVGDFDADGFINDLFLWDHDTGNFQIYSVAAFRTTLRAQGTWHRAFDQMVVGDWDGDGRFDDVVVWDRESERGRRDRSPASRRCSGAKAGGRWGTTTRSRVTGTATAAATTCSSSTTRLGRRSCIRGLRWPRPTAPRRGSRRRSILGWPPTSTTTASSTSS